MSRLAADERVYRWLPTFLFERKYADAQEVIRRLYTECLEESLILGAIVRCLYGQTDIEIITASTMVENSASAKVLQKNDFTLVVSGAEEDWGYGRPTIADKWIR